jgi:hypothetical protein
MRNSVVEYVKVVNVEQEPTHERELRAALIDMSSRLEPPVPDLDNMSVSDLIRSGVNRLGLTR